MLWERASRPLSSPASPPGAVSVAETEAGTAAADRLLILAADLGIDLRQIEGHLGKLSDTW